LLHVVYSFGYAVVVVAYGSYAVVFYVCVVVSATVVVFVIIVVAVDVSAATSYVVDVFVIIGYLASEVVHS